VTDEAPSPAPAPDTNLSRDDNTSGATTFYNENLDLGGNLRALRFDAEVQEILRETWERDAANGAAERNRQRVAPIAERSSTWQSVPLADLLAGNRAPITTSLLTRADGLNLLYPGRLHSFVGETESLKTMAALAAVTQELQAGNHVTFIDFEDSAETIVLDRLHRAFRLPIATLLERFDYVRPSESLFSDSARHDLAALVANQSSLVVCDGVTEGMALHNLNPDKGPEVARFTQLASRPFTDAGSAVLLIDHPTKDTSTRGRYAAGSAHKLNQVDGAAYTFETITLARRGGSGSSRVSIAKDRPGAVRGSCDGKVAAIFVVESAADGAVGWRFDAPSPTHQPGEPWRPTVLMGRVSRHLEQSPKPASQRAIEQAVEGRGEYIRKAIAQLVAEGHAAAEGSDARPLYRSIRPFNEDDDDV
jgi:hypothetical protein